MEIKKVRVQVLLTSFWTSTIVVPYAELLNKEEQQINDLEGDNEP